MSTHCSNKIKNLLKSDKVNELDCNNPPFGISKELCLIIQNMKKKAEEKAEKSKFDGINLTLMEIMSKVGCDEECQRKKEEERLKQDWMDAKNAEKIAPKITYNAEKKYYVYSKGESGWKDVLMKKYTAIASKNKESALKKHKELLDELNTLVSDYKGETLALSKMKELLRIRLDENNALKSAIDSEEATTQTNDRKVVYEDWAQNWLGTIKSLLTTIYIILSIVYLVWGPFLENSEYKTLKGWLKPLVLIILPFTIYYIVQFIYFVNSKIAWYLDNKASKDVYLDLNE